MIFRELFFFNLITTRKGRISAALKYYHCLRAGTEDTKFPRKIWRKKLPCKGILRKSEAIANIKTGGKRKINNEIIIDNPMPRKQIQFKIPDNDSRSRCQQLQK